MSTTNRTVIMYAHECTPYHSAGATVGAQRPAQLAKWLPKFGWNLIVLCCDIKSRNTLDPRGDWEKEIENQVLDVLSKWNKKSSLIINLPSLMYDGFWDKVWQSLVVNQPNGTVRPVPGKINVLKRKIASLMKLLFGDYSQPFQPVGTLAAKTIAKNHQIEVQIGEYGPDAGVFIAKQINKELRIPWLADFRDPWIQVFNQKLRPLARLICRKHIKTASHIVNVTPYWAEMDAVDYHKSSTCITNGFDPEEYKDLNRANFDGTLSMWFGGSLRAEHRIELLLKAIKLLYQDSDVDTDILFRYRGANWEELRNTAQTFDVHQYCDVQDYVARDEALELMGQSNILISPTLVKTEDVYWKNGVYPGKIFEYMGLGKYVVNIPGDNGQLDELIERTKIGHTFSSEIELKDFLKHATQNPDTLKLNNKQEIQQYTRESVARDMATILDNIVEQQSS